MALLTEAQEAAILESVRRGTPPAQAFQANGVTDRTLRRWQAIAEGAEVWPGSTSPVDSETKTSIVRLVQAITDAQAECFSVLTGSLYANATTRNAKTGWFDTQAADKLLSKHPTFRKDWQEPPRMLDVHQSGQVDHVYQLVEALPETEVLSQLEALDALDTPQLPAASAELSEQPDTH